jgi:outer membrane murein-binding lipoprotein Lpp
MNNAIPTISFTTYIAMKSKAILSAVMTTVKVAIIAALVIGGLGYVILLQGAVNELNDRNNDLTFQVTTLKSKVTNLSRENEDLKKAAERPCIMKGVDMVVDGVSSAASSVSSGVTSIVDYVKGS